MIKFRTIINVRDDGFQAVMQKRSRLFYWRTQSKGSVMPSYVECLADLAKLSHDADSVLGKNKPSRQSRRAFGRKIGRMLAG